MIPKNIEQPGLEVNAEFSDTESAAEHFLEEEIEKAHSEDSKPAEKIEQQVSQPRPTTVPEPTPRQMDELMVRVEKILEEDLGEAYNQLSPLAKQEFKIKGEKTAEAIRVLMNTTSLKVKKVFKLILEWLKMLPGINHFFLEQEAKIKTDRIIELHKHR